MARITGGLQKVNSGFRKTSAGVKLGKMIFDPSTQANISPVLIADLLKRAGVPVPKGVTVSLASAQLIMSGGALVNGIEQGKSIAQLSGVGLNVGRATLTLLETCGLMNPNEPAAMIMQTALDGALVLASGGLNILADIAFFFDLIMDFGALFGLGGPNDEEKRQKAFELAQGALDKKYYSIIKPESIEAAKYLKAYQDKKISVVEMLGNVAIVAPDLFPSYFPELKAFFPVDIKMLKFSGEYNGQSAVAVKQWERLRSTDRQEVQLDIAKALIMPVLDQYRIHSAMLRGGNHISVVDMAILSMFPNYFDFVSPDFNVVPVLNRLALNTDDLGAYISVPVESKLTPTRIDSGITFNGVDYVSSKKSVPALSPEKSTKTAVEKAVRQWGSWPVVKGLEANDRQGYRLIKNFWSIMSLAEMIKWDNFFVDSVKIGGKGPTDQIMAKNFGSYPAQISEKHRNLQFLSMARKMNQFALSNVAGFYGKKASEIKMRPIVAGLPAAIM